LRPPRAGKSPNYEIRGSYLGVKVERSAGTPDRKLAARVVAKLKDEIERGHIAKPGEATFVSASISYVKHGGEKRFIMRLAEHFGETPLCAITQQAIDAAAIELYPSASPATRNRQVYSPVSAILKHAGKPDVLKRPKGGRGNVRMFYFTPPQASALIDTASARNDEFGCLLAFLLYTGCRLSEALAMRVEDISLKDSTAFSGKTKNGLPRTVFLPPVLISFLANHPRGLDRTGKLFRWHKCGRLYTWLDDAARASGVVIPDGISFHAFRHTFGAWMRRYGGLDTTGLVETGAWKSRQAASVYEHAIASEESQKAIALPDVTLGNMRGKGR
jgi:integrase